ncbi:MAG: hypothetical protein FWD11_08415, partial [Micrococcales bacterium]|nr:hypothetical protein [Micrococcales bacterium]
MNARRVVRPPQQVGPTDAPLRQTLPASEPVAPPPPSTVRPPPPDAVCSHDETPEGWSEPPDGAVDPLEWLSVEDGAGST